MLQAVSRVGRAVGIEAGEQRVFAWAAATFLLIHAASVTLANAADTLFLKRIGVTLLPLVFLVSSFLLVLSTGAVARVATRRPQLSLTTRTFFGLAIALVPLWLLALADVRSVFIVLVVVSKQVECIAVLVFWVAAGALLNTRQAKRLYAPIVAGGTLGEIVGSFASATIGRTLGIATLLPIAALILVGAGLLARRVIAALPARPARPRGRRTGPQSASALALLPALWRHGYLFRILALSALLAGMLGPLLYFQFAYAADLATRGNDAEMRLLALYAAVRGWLSVAILTLQLLGTARLFRRIGVPLAATLSPLVYLAGFLAAAVRFGLGAAVGAMAAATLQDHAVYDPARQILVTLFPERLRPAATTLIDGPVQRSGGVIGNLIVLIVVAVSTPAAVALAGVPIALLWLVAVLVLWRVYPTLLLQVASARGMRAGGGAALHELVDAGTQRALTASLADADPERVRAACALVVAGPFERAATALAAAAAEATPATRPVLLAALHQLLERGAGPAPLPEAAGHLETLLAAADGASAVERARIVNSYARLAGDLGPRSHAAAVLERYCADPEPAVRLAAAARLRDAGALDAAAAELEAALAAALAGDDTAARHLALDELRATLLDRRPGRTASPERWAASLRLLGERLHEPQDRARAAEIFADLAARDARPVAASAEAMLVCASDADPSVRAAVLRFVGHTRLEAHIGWAVAQLGARDEEEAGAAAEALRAFGPRALEPLLEALHAGSRPARAAAQSILRDLRLDETALRPLIDREIARMQRTVLQLYGLAGGAAPELALQRLRERIGEQLYTVLVLLGRQAHEDRFAVLGRLLAGTVQGRARAVLLEALEALLPTDERARIMPLLDDGGARAGRAAAARLGRPLPSYQQALAEVVADADPLTLTFLAADAAPPLAAAADLVNSGLHGDRGTDPGMLSRVEIVLHLRGLSLFAGLTTRHLSEIAALVREETHAVGTAIVREGDFGESMYLLLGGEVQISRAGQYALTAGPGELFGEMSLFDGETRIATVTAMRRTRVLRLDRHDLFELMDEQPAIAIGICQTLARHARDTIRRLEEKLGK